MISVALDPSETRTAPSRGQAAPPRRSAARHLILGVLGLAGAGAFAAGANTMLSGFAGPQRVTRTMAPDSVRQGAADWPDLRDGLPALATGSVTAPPLRHATAALPPIPVEAVAAERAPRTLAAAPEPTKAVIGRVAKALPGIVDVPVIGPARQASLVPPARIAALVAPLPSETARARTAAATFAALPAEPEAARVVGTAKVERPRAERPAAAAKPALVRAATPRIAVEAAVPEPAPDEDTEVFGLKVPSLAPAGRRIRAGVEALGEAVKGLPDRF